MEPASSTTQPAPIENKWKAVKGQRGIKTLKRGASEIYCAELDINRKRAKSDVVDSLDKAKEELARLNRRKQKEHLERKAAEVAAKQQKKERAKLKRQLAEMEAATQALLLPPAPLAPKKKVTRRGSKGHGKGKGRRPKGTVQVAGSSRLPA